MLRPISLLVAVLVAVTAASEDENGAPEPTDDYQPLTLDEREDECKEKLEIVNALFLEDVASGDFGESTVETIRSANGVAYPSNSLGYVWCSRFNGGLTAAQADPGDIEMFIAPYLPLADLPMTVYEVDELGGNSLESAALKAVTDEYDPSDFQSADDYKNVEKTIVEATYPWSGAASLDEQAPSLGEGDDAPQKTSIARLMAMPNVTAGDDVYMCACGVFTSDMSAERDMDAESGDEEENEDAFADGEEDAEPDENEDEEDDDDDAETETDEDDDADDDAEAETDEDDDDDAEAETDEDDDDDDGDKADGTTNRKLLRISGSGGLGSSRHMSSRHAKWKKSAGGNVK